MENNRVNSNGIKTKKIVTKFGGTSVIDYQAIERCVQIIQQHQGPQIVVLSAPGGITNLLKILSTTTKKNTQQDIIECIQQQVLTIAKRLQQPEIIITRLNELLAQLALLCTVGDSNNFLRYQDRMLAVGEFFSSTLMTQLLIEKTSCQVIEQDIREVLKTNNQWGQAQPNFEIFHNKIKNYWVPLLNKGLIIVTQGFIGECNEGTTTLGRGGSDYTAALLGEAITADAVTIWTDVAGMFTTDPRINQQAKAIPELSFGEAAEMATFGAKVLHPATIAPAVRQGIPIFVGSSRFPEQGGTWIKNKVQNSVTYRAITFRRRQTLITIKNYQMLFSSGFLAQVFAVLAEYNISVDLITTSEVSIAMTLDQINGEPCEISDECLTKLAEFAEIKVEKELALIAIIGNGLHESKGVLAESMPLLSDISIRLICHGASEHNICFLIAEEQMTQAIDRLHHHLIEINNN